MKETEVRLGRKYRSANENSNGSQLVKIHMLFFICLTNRWRSWIFKKNHCEVRLLAFES